MKRRQLIQTLAGGTGTLVLAGCVGDSPDFEEGNGGGDDSDDSDVSDDDGDDEATVEDDVVILEHDLVREDEGGMMEEVSVEGRAENTSDQSFSYVEIRVRFYNENGDLIDSFLDNINDFGAGQTWAFEVMYPGFGEDAAEVDSYDIAVGTSF